MHMLLVKMIINDILSPQVLCKE